MFNFPPDVWFLERNDQFVNDGLLNDRQNEIKKNHPDFMIRELFSSAYGTSKTEAVADNLNNLYRKYLSTSYTNNKEYWCRD